MLDLLLGDCDDDFVDITDAATDVTDVDVTVADNIVCDCNEDHDIACNMENDESNHIDPTQKIGKIKVLDNFNILMW